MARISEALMSEPYDGKSFLGLVAKVKAGEMMGE